MKLPDPSDRPRAFLDLLGPDDALRLSTALAAHDAGEPNAQATLLHELERARRRVDRSPLLTAEVRSVMVSAAERAQAALRGRTDRVMICDTAEVTETITARLVDTPPDVSHYVRLLGRALDAPSRSDLVARRKRLNCPGGCCGAGWRWEPGPNGDQRRPCPECNRTELPENGPMLPAEVSRAVEPGGARARVRAAARSRGRAPVLGLDERGKVALDGQTVTFEAGQPRAFGPRSAEARLAVGLAMRSSGQEPEWPLPHDAPTWSHVVSALKAAGVTFTGAGRARSLARRIHVDVRLLGAVASAAL